MYLKSKWRFRIVLFLVLNKINDTSISLFYCLIIARDSISNELHKRKTK